MRRDRSGRYATISVANKQTHEGHVGRERVRSGVGQGNRHFIGLCQTGGGERFGERITARK
ncbi:MAG TPA: hypothetical protein VFU63_12800, partial [Ktedonobacterales bacterium]|nr:hypothetical protein [Ktedonobacterales bacterium]